MKSFSTSALAAALLLSGVAFAQTSPPAAQPSTVNINIQAQPLDLALNAFAEQTGLQLLFRTNRVTKDMKAPRVSGTYTPQEALSKLLVNSGLRYEYLDAKTVTILPVADDLKTGKSAIAKDAQFNESLHLAIGTLEAEEKEKLPRDVGQRKSSSVSNSQKKADSVEEMIVEDSKIKPFSDANVDLPRTINDPQPYYIFDSETIERSAAVNLEDFLKQRLTMNTAFQSSSQIYGPSEGFAGGSGSIDGMGIPGSATSAINLRGLGIDKTLILVNGRRMPGVNYSRDNEQKTYQPDLNGIPLAAVERIEVLPSSSSAIYGGSAMGGVINIIMKRNYQGGEFSYSYEMPGSSSASTSTADATYGASFRGGKTNLMGSAHYSTSKPMLLGDRADFVMRGLDHLKNFFRDYWNTSDLYQFIGGDIGTTTNIYGVGANGQLANIVLDDGTDLGTPYAHIAPGATSATPIAQRLIPGYVFTLNPDGYGPYGLKQPLGTPSEVTSFNLAVTHSVSSHIDAFAEFMLNDNKSETAYSAWSNYGMSILQVDSGSPFRTARVYVNVGSTDAWPIETTSLTSSATLGFKGRFANGWNGELDYTLSKNKFENSDVNLSDQGSSFYRGMKNGTLDALVDPRQIDLSKHFATRFYGGSSRSDDFAVRLAGPVFHLPWGDPVLALGLNRTKSSSPESTYLENFYSPYDEVPTDNSTWLRTYFAQSQISDALYLEGSVPLVTAKNALPLIRALDLQLAQRTSRYIAQTGTSSRGVQNSNPPYIVYSPTPIDAVGDQGGTPTHSQASYSSHNETFGFKYQPVEAVTLRGSIATAFVPPTYSQLRPDQRVVRRGGRVRSGTGYYQVDVITGGNPALKPQSSRNFDAGLIYEPQRGVLKGLRVNLEYYRIGQYDFISTLSPDQILSVPELAAARVTRDPATGLVALVDMSLLNVAEYSTAGVDLSLSYDKPTAFGTFDFSFSGTQINSERRQLTVNAPFRDFVGFPSRGGPVKHKMNASVSWALREWGLGWTIIRFGNYRVAGSPGDPYSGDYSAAYQGSYSIPAQMYHHLFASYTFGADARLKILSGMSLQLNVSNVFDTVAPKEMSMAPFFLSPLGDVRLRTYRLSIKKSF